MPRWPPLTGPELLRAQWREAAEAGAHRATVVGVTTEVRTTSTEEVRTTTITRIEEEATIITTEATITTTGEATITTTITTEAEATTATIEAAATMFTSEVEATMSTSEEVTIVTTVEEASIVTTEVEATIVTEEAREVLAASISSFSSISRPTLHHLLESAARRQHPLLPFKSPARVTRSKVSFKFVEFTSRMLMMDTMSKLQIDDRLLLNFLSLSVEPRECFQII